MDNKRGRGQSIRQRLRGMSGAEFLSSGRFTEQERMEILLTYTIPKAQTAPIARSLLKEFGTVAEVLRADRKRLLIHPGVSVMTAAFLSFVADTAGLLNAEAKPSEGGEEARPLRLAALREGAAYCARLMKGVEGERMLQVLMSQDSRVLSAFFAAHGGRDSVELPIDLIVSNARLAGASGVVIAHNHPSGDVTPSEADAAATKLLAERLSQNGVRLYEHFIVGGESCRALINETVIDLSPVENED